MHESAILRDEGFLRLPDIIGDPKADPPIPSLIPISKSSWWAGIRQGRYPKPVRLGPNTSAWRVRDIKALLNSFE
jgi:prophage regulatory protein